jgi:transposase-like protein
VAGADEIAIKRGEHPVPAIASVAGVSVSAVRKWVYTAPKRGLMSPGQQGESRMMASVARRPDGQWRARYRDAAGKEHSKHFGRKVDAQRWLDEVTTAVVTGRYVDPGAGRVT